MKISSALFLLILPVFFACNSGPTEHTGVNLKRSESDSTFNLCYASFIKKDTVLFNALVYGDSIKGSMGYKLYEKQQQNGTLLGRISGDTISGMYTFMAADSEYVNEVRFLKKDSLLIEGLGKRTLMDGKFIFSDPGKVDFTGLQLARTDCRQVPDKK